MNQNRDTDDSSKSPHINKMHTIGLGNSYMISLFKSVGEILIAAFLLFRTQSITFLRFIHWSGPIKTNGCWEAIVTAVIIAGIKIDSKRIMTIWVENLY